MMSDVDAFPMNASLLAPLRDDNNYKIWLFEVSWRVESDLRWSDLSKKD